MANTEQLDTIAIEQEKRHNSDKMIKVSSGFEDGREKRGKGVLGWSGTWGFQTNDDKK